MPECCIAGCTQTVGMRITFEAWGFPDDGPASWYACMQHLSRALRIMADLNDRAEMRVRQVLREMK